MVKQLNAKIEELVIFDLTYKDKIRWFYDNRKPGFRAITSIVIIVYVLFKALEYVTGSKWGNSLVGKVLFYTFCCSLIIFIISGIVNYLKSIPKKAEIDIIKKKREDILKELDELVAKCKDKVIYPWWKKFEGLKFEINTPGVYGILLWAKANKASYVNNKRVLNDSIICTGEALIKGRSLIDNYIKDRRTSSKCRVFPSAECIEPDRVYKIADMCFYDVRETLIHVTEGKTQEEIEQGMREYRERLDRREQFSNIVKHDRDLTNEQMRYRGEISHEEYMRRETERNWQEIYELSELSKTKTRVTTDGTYTHSFKNGGYLIFDEDCNTVVAFMLKKKLDEAELYYTTDAQLGDDCEIVRGPVFEKAAGRQNPSIKNAISLMKDYLLVMPESLIKPDGCSAEEWGMWVYLHYKNRMKEEK